MWRGRKQLAEGGNLTSEDAIMDECNVLTLDASFKKKHLSSFIEPVVASIPKKATCRWEILGCDPYCVVRESMEKQQKA